MRNTNRRRGPKPTVTYDGSTYSLRSYKTEVPNLDAMSRIEAKLWLCQHTVPRGYSRPSPLAGFGGAINVGSR